MKSLDEGLVLVHPGVLDTLERAIQVRVLDKTGERHIKFFSGNVQTETEMTHKYDSAVTWLIW
jgi:hypothetical protein